MPMTDKLVMDAHFHGHDGALLLAGFHFAEISLGLKIKQNPKFLMRSAALPRFSSKISGFIAYVILSP